MPHVPFRHRATGWKLRGRAFAHGPHVVNAKLECAQCHRPHAERAPGEVVKFGSAGCVPCHHQQPDVNAALCMKCHGDVTKRTIRSYRGEFAHSSHLEQGLECTTCHKPGTGDPRRPRRPASSATPRVRGRGYSARDTLWYHGPTLFGIRCRRQLP
jgi:predicted CXXCH cytochrome family protein